MTLKIIFNFRNSNNEAFLPAILWLHQHHHLTLACNIGTFSNLGSLNDIPEILYRILEPSKGSGTMAGIKNWEKIQSIIQKKQREINRARLAWEKYIGDEKYRFLHNQISSFFADLLREDLQFLASRKFDKISMASKLCPSLDSACDKSTLICEGIARKLFPCESDEEYKEIDEAHYAYRVRDRLRKQVLVPLRKALDASADRATMPTQKTAHENLFRFHQKVYESLLTGNNTKIKVFPHHIVARLNDESVGYDGVELQWRAMVKAWGKEQGWRNCLSIYNVSESIDGRDAAEDFALGMTLLITELSHEPWREKVLKFSTDPMFCRIEGGDLRSKIEFIRKLKHDKNIRFSKIFDWVLEAAVAGGVSSDMMVKKKFVFTDMDFEKATNNFWAVWATLPKYQSLGFMKLPEIVFWDVRKSVGAPLVKKHNGLEIVKGFSDSCFKEWLTKYEFQKTLKLVQRLDELMKSALCRDELQSLIVFD